MNKFRRLLVFILTFAMCLQMVVPAYAANNQGVTYVATLNTSEISVSDEAQEVVLTVKASKKVNMDSITAHVHTPEGLVLTDIKNADLGFTGGNINTDNGMIVWSYSYTDGDYLTTDTLAVVTFTVPANTAAGEYVIEFDIQEITSDWGTAWEEGETLTATLTVKGAAPACDHVGKTYTYEPNNNGTHKVKCECGQYKTESESCSGGTASSNTLAICQYCGASYGSYSDHTGVTYAATLDTPEIKVSDEAQEVVLTVKASKKVDMDSITAQVHTPEGLVLTDIKNTDLGFGEGNINTENGMIVWYYDYADGDYLITDTMAVVTFTVPANTAAGEYVIKFDIQEITSDWGMAWEEGETLTATLTIKECDHVGTQNTREESASEATCDEAATFVDVTFCTECGEELGRSEPYAKGDPLGHSWSAVSYNWSTDYSDCTASHTCQREICGKEETATAQEVSTEIIKNATCIENGQTKYTASFVEEWAGTSSETVNAPGATGEHSFTVEQSKTAATCVAEGSIIWKCANCDATETEILDIDPTNHTGNNTTDVNAKEATCTEEGYTGDTVCECGITVKYGEAIEMKEHEYTVEQSKTLATCKAEGSIIWKCAHCDATDTETLSIDPTNHTGNNTTGVNAKEATCTEEGYTGDTVCECGVTVVKGEVIEIDLTNHTSEEYTYTDNQDGETHTKAHKCCGTQVDAKEAHEYVEGECVCGAEEPVNAITVIEKGGISYTAIGNVVTVTHDEACKVGYWDETAGKYDAITAVPNEDGSYSFTAPEGVTQVLVVVKGDTTLDGDLMSGDASRLRAYVLGKVTLSPEEIFAADATGDGQVLSGDASKITATILGKTTLEWDK